MVTTPICGKAFNFFQFHDQLTDGLKTRYIAFGFLYYHNYSNDEIGLALSFLWQGQKWENARK